MNESNNNKNQNNDNNDNFSNLLNKRNNGMFLNVHPNLAQPEKPNLMQNNFNYEGNLYYTQGPHNQMGTINFQSIPINFGGV